MMTLVDWLIVLLLNGAVVGYGFYLSRGTKSSSDWFLGGRSLPWWGLGLSIFATSVDNADLVSITGHVYNNGMHIVTVFTLAAVLGCCAAAFLVVPVMYKAGFYTNAEFLEVRFGSSLRLFSALIQIQYRTAILGLMVWSIYLMLQGLVGLEPWQAWSLIVLLVVLTAAYTVWGGLASVVWTDAMQSFIIMAGSVCIFVAVWNGVGGWGGMQNRLDSMRAAEWSEELGWIGVSEVGGEKNGATLTQPLSNWIHIGKFENPKDRTPAWVLLVGWVIVGLSYYTVNHTQTMRLMGARSLWDMKIAALLGGALGIPLMVMVVLLGVFGRILYPELASEGGKADELFPMMAQKYLTTGFKGVVVAGIVSATISTFDSMGSALSALFTRDIYARWIRRDQSDEHYLLVGRWATIGILMMGFLYLPFIVSQRNMVDSTLSMISVFVTPLLTIYLLGALTSVHQKSGLVGLLVGGGFGAICFLYREDVLGDGVGFELPYYVYGRWYVYSWSVLVTGLSMLLATAYWGRAPKDYVMQSKLRETQASDGGWLADSSEQLPMTLEHPFEGRVPVYLQPRWFALLLIVFNVWLVLVCFW